MTSEEFAAIGERVARDQKMEMSFPTYRDRAALYEALERLIEREYFEENGEWHTVLGQARRHKTKADAIDALLGGGK